MTQSVQIGARIPPELAEQVDKLAKAMGRNRAWITSQALQAYVASEAQFIEAIEKGREDYRAGRVIPHTEVMAHLEQRRERRQQKLHS